MDIGPDARRPLASAVAAIAVDLAPTAGAPARQPITAGQLVLAAVFFALLTGLGEAAILLVLKVGLGLYIHFGPQVAWMSPVAQLLLFTPPMLVLLLAHRLFPQAVTLRVVVGVFVFLSVASLMLVHQKLHSIAIALLGLGLAVEAGRHALGNRAKFFRLVSRVTVALASVVVLFAGAVEGGRVFRERRELARQPAANAGAPNILVIILDTVRALNLSLYGYTRSTTPNLERLAQHGVVFERAIATAPWTLPSHASMLTGRWPQELLGKEVRPLKLKVPTITEVLRDNGFRTAGFVANYWYLSRESGLTGGFTHYEDFDYSLGMFLRSSALVRKVTSKLWFQHFFRYYRELGWRGARQINADVLAWLTDDDKRPFFVFINYLDAHANYLPPPPFDTIFHRGVRGRRPPLGDTGHKPVRSGDAVDVEVAAYDGTIAYLDFEVGRLFEELSRRGILDNTLVIVTADHGEELAERGGWGHGHSLYMELLRVPLIVVPPARMGATVRVSAPVSLRSLPSTVLDLAGVRTNVVFPGRSLARLWRSPEAAAVESADTVFAELLGRESVVVGRYHYFSDEHGRQYLYDHYDDLLERGNLATASAYQPVLKSLRAFAEAVSRLP